MDINPLILFNEKVNRLDRCRLSNSMATSGYRIQEEKYMKLDWIAVDGISADDVDAFVLNLRLLIQDRDGFSIRCLERIYNKNNVPEKLTKAFNKQQKVWKKHLDSRSLIKKHGSNENYSNKELFDILFYGGLAHQDKKYISEFLFLTHQGVFSAFVFHFFLDSLRIILGVVRNIRDINKEFIKSLKITTGSTPDRD